jgi:hypothetical protein
MDYNGYKTDFEIWAASKGYDLSLSMTPNYEGVVTFADPITLAAEAAWYAGWMKGFNTPRRVKKK